MFFCLEMLANEAKGSVQSRIDPFASFACKTADNCDNSYSWPDCFSSTEKIRGQISTQAAKSRGISSEIEQDNCFIIQQIDNKAA